MRWDCRVASLSRLATMRVALLLLTLAAFFTSLRSGVTTHHGKFEAKYEQVRRPRDNISVELQAFKKSCWHANFSSTAPIDHTPGPFLIDQPSLCSGDVFLLTIVHSSVQHRARRDLIRSTWGSVRNIRGDRVVTVFVVGTTSDETATTSLKQEADSQADVVQADFVDSYRNLTYKHLYWMKWVTEKCRNLKFVIKVDDDIMVNVFHLHQFLSEGMAGEKNFFLGTLNSNGPQREPGTKWLVTYDEWPDEKYPTYCMGFGYIMSADIIPKLHMCAKWRKYFWVDDVFISGALAEALGIPRLLWKDGWADVDMHPRLVGPAVDQAVVITEFDNAVMPTLYQRVWKAMLRYSMI